MAASDDLISDLVAALKPVRSFREGEDSATFHSPTELAKAIEILANQEVRDLINGANASTTPVFQTVGVAD